MGNRKLLFASLKRWLESQLATDADILWGFLDNQHGSSAASTILALWEYGTPSFSTVTDPHRKVVTVYLQGYQGEKVVAELAATGWKWPERAGAND